MWTVKIGVTLSCDTTENQEVTFQIEETIPAGFNTLNQWEQDVRQVGFDMMRQLFVRGIGQFEQRVLSQFIHRDENCHWVKRGKLAFTIATLFGKVKFQRQRLLCKRCQKWITPLNEALDLDSAGNGKSTAGFAELAALCAVHQPYRLAERMVKQITQDEQAVSFKQIHHIVKKQGQQVRASESQRFSHAAFLTMDGIEGPQRDFKSLIYDEHLYICLDGIYVRSAEGKGRWREGKVGLVCTSERVPVGKGARKSVPQKRYISSFFSSEVLAKGVYAEAVHMGLRKYWRVLVIGDGARWIRKLKNLCFPDAMYILDWFHLQRNVYRALALSFDEEDPRRTSIAAEVTTLLWKGQKKKAQQQLRKLRKVLIREGKAEQLNQRGGLDELLAYIQNNWEGIIRYQRWQKAGYMVASSLVEKAADVVVAKRQKKHQGMHWSQTGGDNISALRTLWLNDDWNDYWQPLRDKAA